MRDRRDMKDAARVVRGALRDVLRRHVSVKQRGVALLIVLVATAVLGTMSTAFVYNQRTDIWVSGNISASIRAKFHARGAMKIAMLAVNAKKSFPMLKTALKFMGKSGAANLEVWRQACEFVKVFCKGEAEFFGTTFLDFSDEKSVGFDRGSCSCEVTAEDGRINLNAAATDRANDIVNAMVAGRSASASRGSSRRSSNRPVGRVQARNQLGFRLYGLFRPMMDQGEFDREEDIQDLITNIMDWTDADEGKTEVVNGQFVDGTGPEADYGKYDYQSKNAKMDTVGEVQLVDGMSTDIYCKHRDAFTVFSTDKINVNDAPLGVLRGVLCEAITDEVSRMQLCYNPTQPLQPMDEILVALDTCRQLKKGVFSTPFTRMSRFTQFFRQYPQVFGSNVQLPVNQATVNQQLGVQTKMVRITAKGTFCWSKDCAGFCVGKSGGDDGGAQPSSRCKSDSDCAGGYCSKRTTEREMTAIINMETGALVYFNTQ